MTEKKESEAKKSKKNPLKPFVLGVILAVVVVVIFGGGWYMNREINNLSEASLVQSYASLTGKRIATVNDTGIAYADLIDDVKALRKFYQSQIDSPPVTDDDIRMQAFSRLAINVIISAASDDLGIEVSEEDLAEVRVDVMKDYESEEKANEELMNRYGWSLAEYEERIIVPYLREQKLRESFETAEGEEYEAYATGEEIRASHILFAISPDLDEAAEEEIKANAEDVLQRIKDGEDFATLAGEFGSDGTSASGGDLGWFGKGAMVPDFEAAVFALDAGQLGEELVKTQFGYHIVKVDNKRQGRDFVKFMDERVANASIDINSDNLQNPFEAPAVVAPQN